jgi:hypothetical protein
VAEYQSCRHENRTQAGHFSPQNPFFGQLSNNSGIVSALLVLPQNCLSAGIVLKFDVKPFTQKYFAFPLFSETYFCHDFAD